MNYRSITLFLLGVLSTLALTHNYSEAEGVPYGKYIGQAGFAQCFGIFNGKDQLVGGNCR